MDSGVVMGYVRLLYMTALPCISFCFGIWISKECVPQIESYASIEVLFSILAEAIAIILGVIALLEYGKFFIRRWRAGNILGMCSRISADIRKALQKVDEIDKEDKKKSQQDDEIRKMNDKYELLNDAANQICKDEGLVDKLYEAYRNNRSVKQIVVGKALRELRHSKDKYRAEFEKQKEEDIGDCKGAEGDKTSIKSLRQKIQRYVKDADVPKELRDKLNEAYGKYKELVEEKLAEIEDKVAEIDKEIRSNIWTQGL